MPLQLLRTAGAHDLVPAWRQHHQLFEREGCHANGTWAVLGALSHSATVGAVGGEILGAVGLSLLRAALTVLRCMPAYIREKQDAVCAVDWGTRHEI